MRFRSMFNSDKLKEKLRSMRDTAEKTASETFLTNRVSAEIQEERFNICKSCEFLYTPTNTCKKCGCFMGVKTWMQDVKCPIDKWGAAIPPENEHLVKQKR